MTADGRVRRLLARVCSPRTMARVVDPTLADAAWERGRPAWLAYVALARALALHAVVSTPGTIAGFCADDRFAMPKAAGIAATVAVLGAMLLIAPFMFGFRPPANVPAVKLALMLTPQAFALTLPLALLVAIPLALKRHALTRRLAVRTIALSVGATVVTGVVMAIVPDSNQAFRVLASGNPAIRRGPNELHNEELREKIEVLNLTPGGRVAARRLEYLYQLRLALVCAALPLGLLALGVSMSPAGKRRPLLTGIAAMAASVSMMYALSGLGAASVTHGAARPYFMAWAPMLAISGAAALLLSRSSREPSA
jgi:hypothetical protein